MPGHDPENPILISRDPSSPHGWRAQAKHPRQPNERGWVSDPIGDAIRRLDDADHARRELAQFNKYPIGVVVSGPFKGLIAFEVRSELADWLGSCMQSALDREPNPEERATDATFENETRPHR
jgi:hypothetical protein